MCINPRTLDTGHQVGCRECWQCKSNRIQDWVGRCIAESQVSGCARSVTLTYGRDKYGNADHVRAAILTYSDVQKYFKRLRKNGFPVRYFVVGEFGAVKGRCHWHALLFFQGESPKHVVTDSRTGEEVEVDMPLEKRFIERHWPHGWSYWEEVTPASVRYVCKYIQKDLRDAERQRQIGMSRFPPLGAVHFSRLAGRYVEQGLSPQQPIYHFRGVTNDKGRPEKFRLFGRSRDLFIAEFLEQWERARGGHPPHSDMVSEYLDRVSGYLPGVQGRAFRPGYCRPWLKPPKGGEVVFSEAHNSWVWLGPTDTLFWSFDDDGKRAWHAEIRTETIADRMREASEKRAASLPYISRRQGE